MGFLYALLMMCSWMIYGGANFYMNACNITMEEGLPLFFFFFFQIRMIEQKFKKKIFASNLHHFLPQNRSVQFNTGDWTVQSMDWLGDCQLIASLELGGFADNLPNISDRLVGHDNK